MTTLDKAFIEAYGRQGAGAGRLMSLSDALELSHNNEEADCAMEEPIACEGVDAAEEVKASGPVEEAGELQALLQVDNFSWPDVCKRLETGAGGPIAAVADRVSFVASNGRSVVGITGDCVGSGATTLLLCVAKYLAENMRIVIVDANSDNPDIARKLSLLPDVGLKDVAEGQVALPEAMIDSLDDRLTVLPYSGNEVAEYGDQLSGGVDSLRALALHYDLVLVDLGVLPSAADKLSLLNGVDTAVIVRCACAENYDATGIVSHVLANYGVEVSGVVENRCIAADEKLDGAADAA